MITTKINAHENVFFKKSKKLCASKKNDFTVLSARPTVTMPLLFYKVVMETEIMFRFDLMTNQYKVYPIFNLSWHQNAKAKLKAVY